MTESFLQRWSRRKQAVKESDALEKPLLPVEPHVESRQSASDLGSVVAENRSAQAGLDEAALEKETLDQEAQDQATLDQAVVADGVLDEEPALSRVLTDADMPDLDSLHARSDVSMFFSSGVSAELRRKALRTLFHQPEFNVRDPLDDYALDYSQPEKLVGGADQLRRWASEQMTQAMDQARASLQDTFTEILEEASDSSSHASGQTPSQSSPRASETASVVADSRADKEPKVS